MMTLSSVRANSVSLDLPPLQSLINGKWMGGAVTFPVHDKFTHETLCDIVEATQDHVGEAVRVASEAFATTVPPPHERARILQRVAELVDQNRQRFLDLMVAETGFTVPDATGDIDRTLVSLRLCAEEATRIVGETVAFAASPGQHQRVGFTMRFPLGIVCAITPFNSPLNTVAHKIGPALAAGNAVILKPSGLTPLTAALFCQTFIDAGLPPGLLSLLQGMGDRVGNWLLAEQAIAYYSFTGSTRVGRIIQQAAGLRRTQMELGSIASTIVCADADLDRAVPKIANASFRKAGQVCTSVQRLYVEEQVVNDVAERLVAAASSMPAGNPRDERTRVGPMISEASAKRAESWVEEARLGQARVLHGGTRERSVLTPTVLTNVRDGMRVIEEEIFAPCLSILPFSKLEEAIGHANNTPFGLSSGIFTRDVNRAMAAAKSLRFGSIHINESSSSRADGMPFGGVKDSGFGHEGPKYAIREVTEERLVTFNS
jgi:succinate-semialdehyde dehydrogenase/glutarate-semialdehyde dehydrogenase